MDQPIDIQANLERVEERIARAAQHVGRNPRGIKLVVVSKGQSVEIIEAAVRSGARIFGENYPEETVAKIQAVKAEGIEWHMIGHLQSRKAPLVCDHFTLMHSLDSLRLAEKMERLLAERNRILPVLLEFNVGEEASKSGWLAGDPAHWQGLLPEVSHLLQLPHLQVAGLMTMPPLTAIPAAARAAFVKLVQLRDYLHKAFPEVSWRELSMGTSADYEIAVEEGATFVRIGTFILGPRQKQ